MLLRRPSRRSSRSSGRRGQHTWLTAPNLALCSGGGKDCFSVGGSCGQAVNATLRTTLALAAMDPADFPDEELASRCNKAVQFCCACCTGRSISLAYLCMLDAVQRRIAGRMRKSLLCAGDVRGRWFTAVGMCEVGKVSQARDGVLLRQHLRCQSSFVKVSS